MSFPHRIAHSLRFLCLAVILAPGALCAAPRVAVVVDAPDPVAAEWQPLLVAELTRLAPETELVERAELTRLWMEREQSPASAMTAPLGVDHYLRFHQVTDARWIVARLDAATGRELGSFAVDASDPSASSRLVDAAARLLAAPASTHAGRDASRLAVIESPEAAGDAGLFVLAARLRATLADEGVVVLDRALVQEIAVEQNDAARGFRSSAPDGAPLGIDHYLVLSPTSVRLVRVSDGVVLGLRPRDASRPEPDEVNALQRWALPLLDRAAAPATDYLPQVEVEALDPFYRGLAHHDAGRHSEAVGAFIRAYELNGRFREAYEWSARSHAALGLNETAAAIRRFLATEFLENLAAPTGRLAPVDGIAFLGVGGSTMPKPARDALAAAIASELGRRSELGLRLPDELGRLRTEFDWAMFGIPPDRTSLPPALFTRWTLSAEAASTADGLRLRFTQRDALGLLPPATRELRLPSDAAGRTAALADFLAAWPLPPGHDSSGDAKSASPAAEPSPASRLSIDTLATEIVATSSEPLGAAARLRLLLAEPAHPLGIVRRSATADEPLASFLEHGRRADAIRRLPADSTARRWLEFLRALEHLDPLGPGPLYSGEKLDARAELARLAGAQADDGPGLAARYHLLFLSQASLSPARIATEAEALRERLKSPPDRLADCAESFDLALASLARLARLAANPRDADLADLDKFSAPTELPVFRLTPEGLLSCKIEAYAITRKTFAGLSTADAIANARALLALNGRPHDRDSYTGELLAAHPRSLALAQFVVLRLARSLHGNSIPADADDWAGRRELARAGLAYALDTFTDAYERQTEPAALATTNLLATALLGVLGQHRIRDWIPAEAHAEAFHRLVASETAARARTEFPRHFNPNTLPLIGLSPETVRAVQNDVFNSSGVWIPSPDPIRQRFLAREAAFSDLNPARDATRRSWWWLSNRWETERAFTAAERAALLARPLDAILRTAPSDPDDTLLGHHFELGLFLLQGRRHADAERMLAPLAALEVSPAATRTRRTLVGNALFRLAQIQHIGGRLPEALATARRGLALSEGHGLPYHEQELTARYTEDKLTAQFLRLLAELRFAPDHTPLPDRVGFVSVPTTNGDNPRLVVYYRLPASAPEHHATARVLVLSPVANTDPLEALCTAGPWTDFADAHDLVLVAPRFHVSDTVSRGDHLFTHPRFAASWSGDALLRALDQIAGRAQIETSRLLLYGYASGSSFASHFAAWRPDRIAAVALSQGSWSLANQPFPGLRAPSAQRAIPYWIGSNPWNNHDSPGGNPRHAYTQDFAARLREAGVPVEWAEFPAPSSIPSEAMEEAARAFLARQLSSSP